MNGEDVAAGVAAGLHQAQAHFLRPVGAADKNLGLRVTAAHAVGEEIADGVGEVGIPADLLKGGVGGETQAKPERVGSVIDGLLTGVLGVFGHTRPFGDQGGHGAIHGLQEIAIAAAAVAQVDIILEDGHKLAELGAVGFGDGGRRPAGRVFAPDRAFWLDDQRADQPLLGAFDPVGRHQVDRPKLHWGSDQGDRTVGIAFHVNVAGIPGVDFLLAGWNQPAVSFVVAGPEAIRGAHIVGHQLRVQPHQAGGGQIVSIKGDNAAVDRSLFDDRR